MTDPSQVDQSPAMPRSASPWTQRRINAIYLIAYIILALIGVAVMAATIWIAKIIVGTWPVPWNPDIHPAFRPLLPATILTFLFWGSLLAVGAHLQPKDVGVPDYGDVWIVSIGMKSVGVGFVLLSGLACVQLAVNAGVHPWVAAAGALGIALGFRLINMIVGPMVQQRSPEIWKEALTRNAKSISDSVERAKNPVSTRNRTLAVITLGIGVLLFSLAILLD